MTKYRVSHVLPLNNSKIALVLPILTNGKKYFVQEGGDEWNRAIQFREVELPRTAIKYTGSTPVDLTQKIGGFICDNQHYCAPLLTLASLAEKLSDMFGKDPVLEILKISSDENQVDADFYRRMISLIPVRLSDVSIKFYIQSAVQETAWLLLISKAPKNKIEELKSRLGAQVFYLDDKSKLNFRSYDGFIDAETDAVIETIEAVKLKFPWLEDFSRPAAPTNSITLTESSFETNLEVEIDFLQTAFYAIGRQEERIAFALYCLVKKGFRIESIAALKSRAKSETSALKNICLNWNYISKLQENERLHRGCMFAFSKWSTGDKWLLIIYLQKWFGSYVDIFALVDNLWHSTVTPRMQRKLKKLIEEGRMERNIDELFEQLPNYKMDTGFYEVHKSVIELNYYFENNIWFS